MNLFYVPELNQTDTHAVLNEEESKHACKVLRYKIGDQIVLMNGKGSFFYGKITDNHPKHCHVEIDKVDFEEPASKQIHIAICPTKNSDRTEWFVEKATELGIHEISFILSKNSERKTIKLERYEKIILSASKQSMRKYLPKLNDLQAVGDFVKRYPYGAIAHCASGDKIQLKNNFQKNNYPILIGPEGDFTSEEIALVLKHKFDPISLGKTRLRTETAALYACVLAKILIE